MLEGNGCLVGVSHYVLLHSNQFLMTCFMLNYWLNIWSLIICYATGCSWVLWASFVPNMLNALSLLSNGMQKRLLKTLLTTKCVCNGWAMLIVNTYIESRLQLVNYAWIICRVICWMFVWVCYWDEYDLLLWPLETQTSISFVFRSLYVVHAHNHFYAYIECHEKLWRSVGY